jgi:hypothetical protein
MALTLPTDSGLDRRPSQASSSIVRSVAVLALAVGLTVAVLAGLSSVMGSWS